MSIRFSTGSTWLNQRVSCWEFNEGLFTEVWAGVEEPTWYSEVLKDKTLASLSPQGRY